MPIQIRVVDHRIKQVLKVPFKVIYNLSYCRLGTGPIPQHNRKHTI